MSLKVIFLGTGGSVPTSKRNLSSVLIKRKDELLMFDCGEGTQRQMMKSKVSMHRKMKILITHLHGDHILGLPGLLQTMALLERKKKLYIYGPLGIKRFFECLNEFFNSRPFFPIEIIEVLNTTCEKIILNEKEYFIKAIQSEHIVPSITYALVEYPRPGKFNPEKAKALGVPKGRLWSKIQQGQQAKLEDGRIINPKDIVGSSRPGRKIVYTGDTASFIRLINFAKDATLLIHESSFDDTLADRAKEDAHSTPSQAAKIAKKSKIKQLILTHISARYKNSKLLLNQAKKIFSNTTVAEDLMEIDIPPED